MNYQKCHNFCDHDNLRTLQKTPYLAPDNNPFFSCSICGQMVIRKALYNSAQKYQMNQLFNNTDTTQYCTDQTIPAIVALDKCKTCGNMRHQHSGFNHQFNTGENPSPFDVSDKDVLGYDPLAFTHYPASLTLP